MNKSKIAAVVASLALCALTTLPAQATDAVSGKGFLDSGWNYVQYLFADGAASTAMSDANKAAAGKNNFLGLGAARELQIQAETQIQQRDFLGADKTLRRALSLAPELDSTQALLAVAIDGQGRGTEARAMLEALSKTAADRNINANAKADVMGAVAAAYNSLGDPKRALQIYNQLIADNIDSAAVHAGRGEVLQRLDDDGAALASFQLASEVEPRFPNLELKRAQSLEKLGRNSEAENAYRVALQLDPTSAAARASIARLEGRRSTSIGDAATTQTVTATSAVATAPAVVAASANVAAAVPVKEDATKKSAKPPAAERLADLNALAEKMAATAAATTTPAAAATATSTPTPTPIPAKVPSAEAQAAVLAQLGKWQAAWTSKEVDAYLGFYAKDFAPVKMNRAAWEADRRIKLNKPGAIQVNIVEPSFALEGGVLKVTFNQEYVSSNFRDHTRKRLEWVQDGGEWRIQRELTR